jgi:hypothetical protein
MSLRTRTTIPTETIAKRRLTAPIPVAAEWMCTVAGASVNVAVVTMPRPAMIRRVVAAYLHDRFGHPDVNTANPTAIRILPRADG